MPPSRRRKEPPIAGPLPESLELTLGDQIYIAKDPLPPGLRNRLLRLAAFQNPEFYKAQAMRLPTYDKPRIIGCAEDHPHHIGLPRGCLEDVQKLALGPAHRVPSFATNDARARLWMSSSTANCGRSNRPPPTRCWPTIRACWPPPPRSGRPWWPPGSLPSAASTRWSSCIAGNCWNNGWSGCRHFSVCRRKPSAESAAAEEGRHGSLDVAVIQSLVRKGVVNDCVGEYGHLIVDECHHLSAQSFEQVVRRAKAKFVTGLSATVTRKDGHHPIIFMQCGPVRHRVDAKAQAAARPFEHTVLVRPTSFRPLKAANAGSRESSSTISTTS